MNKLADLIQGIQNQILGLAQIIPEGISGRNAVLLSFESMRLAWYMVKGDRVGIAEKSGSVRIAYGRLLDELNGFR